MKRQQLQINADMAEMIEAVRLMMEKNLGLEKPSLTQIVRYALTTTIVKGGVKG